MLGFFLVFLTLRDVFQVVIVPRAVSRSWRLSAVLTRTMWRYWPAIAYRFYKDEARREDFFGTFAPLTMIALLAAWIVVLVTGFGLLFYAERNELVPTARTLGEALYFAGTSLLTIGYGDIVPRGAWARVTAMAAGTSGLAVVAVVTAYLFAVFGAFQRRETFVVTIGARAGAPPSGVGLLAIAGYAEMSGDIERVLQTSQAWLADVLESHLAYPILSYFRSSHDYESWIGTVGTLLDASVLKMTTVRSESSGQARITYALGRHLTHDFTHYYGLHAPPSGPGIERWEFDNACERLVEAGYELRDRDEAWTRFSQLRAEYAAELNAMARWLEIPPLQWVGDRSLIAVEHMRKQLPYESLK